MKRKPIFLRLTAGALAAALLASCAQSAETAPAVTVVKDQPLGADCAWINSSVDGAIGADTATDVNTDFYTAINRDWLLQPLPAGQDERKKKAVKPSHGNFKENGAVYLYLEQQLYTHPDLRTALSVHHEHHQHSAAPLRH